MSVSTGASDTKAQRISYVHDASDSEVGLGASGLAIDVEVLRSTVGTQNSPEGPSKQPVLQSRYPSYSAHVYGSPLGILSFSIPSHAPTSGLPMALL